MATATKARKSVPASPVGEAGPVPMWSAGEALVLSDRLRARLSAVVDTLLADPELAGAPDSVRLAVVVLAAKTNAADLTATVSAPELGRWLGVSDSLVRHQIRPRLQRGPAPSVEVEADPAPGAERGRTLGLRWTVEALASARHEADRESHLRLTKAEFATWLRLMEALIGPGWRHRDGSVTEPGILGSRTGHGAATERLALVRAVLAGRPDGTVRMCGGPVDARGRAATTVGRLLDTDSQAGERVLEQLATCGALARVPGARERLVVPAVAAAHQRMRNARRAAGRAPQAPVTGAIVTSEGAGASAGGGQIRLPEASSLVSPYKTADFEVSRSAALHADHTPVVEDSEESAGGESGCSGVAGQPVTRRRRKRAHPREDRPDTRVTGSRRESGVPARRLRRDKQDSPPASGSDVWRAAWRPMPDDVAEVLTGPARPLWTRLRSPDQQQRAIDAVRRALGVISGTIGPDTAPDVLYRRLTARLTAQGGAEAVADPLGWLTARGLPRRGSCLDSRCDDGTLMDTGGDCAACAVRIGDRRAIRRQVAEEVAVELHPATRPAERAKVTEARLRELTTKHAAEAEERNARNAEAAAERRREVEAEVAARRAAAAEAEAARAATAATAAARPCADCGTPEAGGLCPACTTRRQVADVLEEAAILTAAVPGIDPTTEPAAARQAVVDARQAVADRIDAAVADAAADGVQAALLRQVALWAADAARADAHRAALAAWTASPASAAEARQAAAAAMRDRHASLDAARRAADTVAREARELAARWLLDRTRTALVDLARAGDAGDAGDVDAVVPAPRTEPAAPAPAGCPGHDGAGCGTPPLDPEAGPLCGHCTVRSAPRPALGVRTRRTTHPVTTRRHRRRTGR
ncbi:hypothetical protein GCM10027160_52260 [Streptomyces calidiresistens]|uniref:Uncharacterized protein n=1 Tax=Streptomyces calidiresistens TaxID=1485586 RepID=A0A7W3XVV9_9ACTN|nr:hypothetical protein [Streptomyces calidiresistens]MBB0229385.1 hypothetical protein [Streptomyces calidiresistens]